MTRVFKFTVSGSTLVVTPLLQKTSALSTNSPSKCQQKKLPFYFFNFDKSHTIGVSETGNGLACRRLTELHISLKKCPQIYQLSKLRSVIKKFKKIVFINWIVFFWQPGCRDFFSACCAHGTFRWTSATSFSYVSSFSVWKIFFPVKLKKHL